MPTRDASRFRVTEVIKGTRPPSGTVEGGYPRSGFVLDRAAPRSGKPLLLVRDDLLATWEVLGSIDADHHEAFAGDILPAKQLSVRVQNFEYNRNN